MKNSWMDFSFVIVMLWTMMISTLIVPSLLPYPSYGVFFGLIGMSVWYAKFFRDRRTNPDSVVQISLYLLIVFATCAVLEQDVYLLFRQVLTFGLLTFVLLSANEKQIILLLKAYIGFCIVMSLCGAIASILINANLLDWTQFQYNLSKATNGRIMRDSDTPFGYSFPYGLGLVLTGSFLYNFMGVEFFRASGWAHEPTSATFFVIPALIILIRERIFSRNTRIFGVVCIVLFLIACFAVGSVLAVALLAIVWALFSPGKKHLYWRIAILLTVISTAVFGYFRLLHLTHRGVDAGSESLFASKFDSTSEAWGAALAIFTADPAYQILIAGYIVLTLILAFRALRAGGTAETFGLIFLYLLLHSAKGIWGHLTQFLFSFVFFFFLVYSLNTRFDQGLFAKNLDVK